MNPKCRELSGAVIASPSSKFYASDVEVNRMIEG